MGSWWIWSTYFWSLSVWIGSFVGGSLRADPILGASVLLTYIQSAYQSLGVLGGRLPLARTVDGSQIMGKWA